MQCQLLTDKSLFVLPGANASVSFAAVNHTLLTPSVYFIVNFLLKHSQTSQGM